MNKMSHSLMTSYGAAKFRGVLQWPIPYSFYTLFVKYINILQTSIDWTVMTMRIVMTMIKLTKKLC